MRLAAGNDVPGKRMSTTASLRGAGRNPVAPQSISVAGEVLNIQQWLRVLPGKRLVGRGGWQEQQVLAKLFIANGAERHWQRESTGVQALQRAGIPTPDLLGSGELPGGGYYLLTEYLDDARTLQQRWETLPDSSPASQQAQSILHDALRIIAAMHAQGIMQTDLHLGNFLQRDAQLYVIDGDAIEVREPGKPLPLSDAQSNLGLFFAQLLPEWDAQLDRLLPVYLEHNPAVALQHQDVLREVGRQRRTRLNNFLGKTLRDCSQFAVTRTAGRFCVVLRAEADALAPLLADPDSAFAGQSLLKDGGSSTVARIRINERDLVVKRYNIKGVGHWLKRFWRPSRAWHSWLSGWRLSFLGIATPQPLAMIERRMGPLRREAWLITEYCAGDNLLQRLGASGDELPEQSTADALLQVFNQLHQARISHGDCKATNLLWHGHQVYLIDLDAMQAHGDESGWRKGWARDRARFIRNWRADSALAEWLERALPR